MKCQSDKFNWKIDLTFKHQQPNDTNDIHCYLSYQMTFAFYDIVKTKIQQSGQISYLVSFSNPATCIAVDKSFIKKKRLIAFKGNKKMF